MRLCVRGDTVSDLEMPCYEVFGSSLYLPVWQIAEALGAEAVYLPGGGIVSLSDGNSDIIFMLGGPSHCLANGLRVPIEKSAYCLNGKAMAPIKEIADALGYEMSIVNETVILERKEKQG